MNNQPFIAARANRTLRGWAVLGALFVWLGTAWAQANQSPPAPAERSKALGHQQQRRAALRAALQAQRDPAVAKQDRTARQLTPAERAKLREQLHQQRREALRNRDVPAP